MEISPSRALLPPSRLPFALAAIALLAAACNRSQEPSPPKPALAASSAGAPTPAPSFTSRIPAPRRLVAVGDLHGDLAATRTALRMAGAIDDKDRWAGGDLLVVQTGDQVDRGDQDREVLDLFEKLAGEAKAAGGAVLALVGNHEVMNVRLELRDVSKPSAAAFIGVAGANPGDPRLSSVEEPLRGRAAAFLPGGPYARILAQRPVVAVVGDTVFVHGGLSPKHVRYGLDRVNRETSTWIQGDAPKAPAIMTSEDAPTWLRRYSAAPDQEDCRMLAETLAMIPAKRMVMGHTVQRNGINSACAEQAWRIDVGMSAAYEGKPQVLQIEGDKVTVLREP